MAWEYILDGIKQAVHLIVTADPDIIEITLRSIRVSGIATLMAALWSFPIGIMLGMHSFTGKNILKGFFNSLLGIPTVVLGLILYLMLVPFGPLGFLKLIYTEMGISFGQSLLITPIMISFIASSIEAVEGEIRELARTLGAGEIEASIAVMSESISGVLLAVIASFNRAIAELGIAIMIGGNIFVKGSALNTRVLTTAMQMYTARGEIDMAIALGIILLSIVFAVSTISNLIQSRLA
ncbi:ABC-type tungstate transport system, periplasmic component [Archaeoglobus sulfaticallidus PM70-1]|uniref:ABC-type tungstate transport system, periplasmic component n=1 Tax=Archaeoglobus sulfaticallidus PM70-1 TaxID=387631 RepID=N0BJD0_9EURY|nr:ABC transporter permease [Archaeoglobus sulfaticallidus]AGK60566.1 ABC-type tungstate transport system, periplasmic component [Archaeoglobus sulfaticallidus PM70-1]